MDEMPKAPKQCPQCGAPLAADAPEGLCPRCLMALNLSAQTDAPTGEVGPGGTRVIKLDPKSPPLVSDIAPFFPQLEILECLGWGGMGVVYKARQPRLNRLVALKILSREKEKDPHFSERFQREAQALARLNHPSIVTVYDFGATDGLFYLLMEFVDGMNLRQLLQSGKISPEQALAIVPHICEALQYAHEQGIVHRDIKPENILLDKQGRVKIADFGIAKILGPERKEEPLTGEQAIGTPHYMAPEQVEKPATVDHRADIYSLGVVFYEMLTGELPLGKFSPPSQKVRIDVRLDEVVMRALEKEPERRYQQASQVKNQVETIATTPPLQGAQSGQPKAQAGGWNPGQPPPPNFTFGAGGAFQPQGGAPFSKLAIFGFAWAACFFATALVWMLLSGIRSSGFGRAEVILMLVGAFPLAFTAPIGATVLGWMAVSRIRRSEGRLRGLGLALFDGLVFPLLLLDVLILPTFSLATFWVWYHNDGARGLVLVMVLVVAVLVDYLIARNVWHMVNRPIAPAPAPFVNPNAQPRTGAMALKIAAAAALVLFLLIVIAVGASLFLVGTHHSRAVVQDISEPSTPAVSVNVNSQTPAEVAETNASKAAEEPAALREARANLEQLRSNHSEDDPEVQQALHDIKVLEEQASSQKASNAARVTAAEAITNFAKRDEILAGLARDAAKGSDVDTVKRALEGITNLAIKDNAANDSARALAGLGLLPAAVDVAEVITNLVRKDQTMAILAKAAAGAGKAELVKKAIEEMTNMATRDNVAEEAARELATLGQRADAVEIAGNIMNFAQRDRVLAELAK